MSAKNGGTDPGDHSHDKEYTIVINGTEHTLPEATITYEQLVTLAYPSPPSPDTRFTVTFRKAAVPHEGSLSEGMSVEVKHRGTIFNVKATGKS